MIVNSFDNKSKPIVSLKDFYGEKKHIIDKCLIIFSHQIFEYILANYQCENIAEIHACNGLTVIYSFNYHGEKIGFYLTPIGSTGASEYAIETNWLTGANKFVMFGSCGSLDKQATKGKFVVPTSSYRDEGMSYHYAKPDDYIDIRNAEVLGQIMKQINIPFTYGKTWTTDAMLRETIDQFALRKKEGCIVVEMEIAGLQAVSDFYGFQLFAFVQPGDVLLDDAYEIAGLSNANHDISKFFIALEIVKRI